jgi:Putative auto-transporter adhesin, head GIN domain
MTVAPTPVPGRRAPHRRHPLLFAALLVLLAVIAALLVTHDAFDSSSSSGAVQGSGHAATQTRQLPSFTGVELAGSNNVTVIVGPKQSVVVHADDNLLNHVTTDVQSGTLVIGNTPGSIKTKSPMSVDVTVPALDAMTLTGSGLVAVAGLKAPELTVLLSGSGLLRASGSVQRLTVTLGGSGDAQLDGVVAEDVHAVVSGSGRILVTATKTLDATVPGSGAIVYGGHPAHVTTSVTGSGTVIPN